MGDISLFPPLFALGMAAAERFGLARRLHCAVAGSARLNGKIAALRFMPLFLAGRNFIPQQPDPAGGPFRGLAEPGNAQRELPWTAASLRSSQ